VRRVKRRWKTVLRPQARRWGQWKPQGRRQARQRAGPGLWALLRLRARRAWPQRLNLIRHHPPACRLFHRGNP